MHLLFFQKKTMKKNKKCVKCDGKIKKSRALVNVFASDDGREYQRTTTAVLVPCLKCVDCGHSFKFSKK